MPDADVWTVGVFLLFLAFAVFQWLRWRSRLAWLDRVWVEQAPDEDEE